MSAIISVLYPCPNPSCKGKKHALCRLNRKHKSDLGVICDCNGDGNKFFKLPQSITDNIADCDIVGIPEHHTAESKRKLRNAGNLQFVLMIPTPGQEVDRSAPAEIASAAKCEKIKQEIDQRLQAIKELDKQIEELDIKRREIREDSRKLGAKLSEEQTGVLWTKE